MTSLPRALLLVLTIGCLFDARSLVAQASSSHALLLELIDEVSGISAGTRSEEEYRSASADYRRIQIGLQQVRYDALDLQDQVDYELLDAHVRRQIFEIDTVQLYKLNPVSYYSLGQTNRLFIRPGAVGDDGVRRAVGELNRLPIILNNAQRNLTTPARVWTENAIYQAYYAKMLLEDYVPGAAVDDPELKRELLQAADSALRAVEEYEAWLERELLPRSTRSPAWDPHFIDFYQLVHEQLDGYDVDGMLRVAEEEERQTHTEMVELAKRIHPSGDLRTVWESMKDEAPPWEGVLPMAQSFVEMATEWLTGEGSHVVTIPDFDYGARITAPMGRRTLSFGGATGGPTVAGRQSGYYVLTPLEDRLSPEEKASRIRSYNPYWTHVISYHEWLGHNVQRAAYNESVTRPMRRTFSSSYFGQAWSFYLEKLLPDEGYFADQLDYQTALKTHMARLQMRMWRIQRILTKLEMAKGEMTFDEAVQAYIDKIGMEPTNAFIEVQRDSQSPSPPGREIIGERMILELRAEYQRRMGDHYSLKDFNDRLLTYGNLPFRQIRRLMFGT